MRSALPCVGGGAREEDPEGQGLRQACVPGVTVRALGCDRRMALVLCAVLTSAPRSPGRQPRLRGSVWVACASRPLPGVGWGGGVHTGQPGPSPARGLLPAPVQGSLPGPWACAPAQPSGGGEAETHRLSPWQRRQPPGLEAAPGKWVTKRFPVLPLSPHLLGRPWGAAAPAWRPRSCAV